eukprot:TRINITY_DN23_c0_g1_i3.p1 TRINITY_DN23_c0_g1~~TRINITY_DN23_c0_g1_i3.p1  ORF type:complete len:1817 (+),score=333.77 TRINITY_DN23_c0_g1_i3:15467-20917(+)
MTPPPRTPSRYNLRRRPSTATPVPTPRMLRRLNAEEQLLQHPPSEPRLLRSATKKRPVTADPSVRRLSPGPQRPSTAPLRATPRNASPNQSPSLSVQPTAAEADVSTPLARRRRPSTAPASDRVLRSASRTRQRDQPQEVIQTSSRKSDATRAPPPSRKRLTARARALLPHPLNNSKSDQDGNLRSTSAQPHRGRSRSKTRTRASQINNGVPDRERSRSRSQARVVRTRSQSAARSTLDVNAENDEAQHAEEMDDTMRRLFHGAQGSQSSSPDFSLWLYQDLVEECKKNGLPCRGKKDDIVSRLQRFHTRAAGALARRSTTEKRTSTKPRAAGSGSDHEEGRSRIVSNAKLLSEKEKPNDPAGEPERENTRDSDNTGMNLECETGVAPLHISIQRDNTSTFDHVTNNQEADIGQAVAEVLAAVASTVSEENTKEAIEAITEQKPRQERNGLNAPPTPKCEETMKPSSEEHVSESGVKRDSGNDPTQHVVFKGNAEGLARQELARENPGSDSDVQMNVEDENEQRGSMYLANSESSKEQAADPQGKKASVSPKEFLDSKQPNLPSSRETILQNTHSSHSSNDNEVDTQDPKKAPFPTEKRAVMDAIDELDATETKAIENAVEKQKSASKRYSELVPEDKEVECTRNHNADVEGNRTDSVLKESEKTNELVGPQLKPATKHQPPTETSKENLDSSGAEFQIGQPRATIEAKSGPSPKDALGEALLSSLPELHCEKRADGAFKPSKQGAAVHPRAQQELQDAVTGEQHSQWREAKTERNEDVAQTPDVIDLDAESDGNDDDDEIESRRCNSGSNENSADESQRPVPVVAVDPDEVTDDLPTPRLEDANESKSPDTDEDNDEDEDDDEESSENCVSPPNDAFEFGVEGEGPQPMDATFSEQGEERQGTNISNQKESVPSFRPRDPENHNEEGNEEFIISPLDSAVISAQMDERKGEDVAKIRAQVVILKGDDEVIDLQEDSRMADNEDDEEVEADFGDCASKLDEYGNEHPGKILSDPEKNKSDSASSERSEEFSDPAADPAVPESCDNGEKTAEQHIPVPHKDMLQNSPESFKKSDGMMNTDRLSPSETKNDIIEVSAGEENSNDSSPACAVAKKSLIKPQLISGDMFHNGEESDSDESDVAPADTGKGIITEIRAGEQDGKEGKEGKIQLSNLRETEQPEHVQALASRSSEEPEILFNRPESSTVQNQNQYGETVNTRNCEDDTGEFSESPLPSPCPPQGFDESQKDDDLPQAVAHTSSEGNGDPFVDFVNEPETPEGFQGGNSENHQSEALEENYLPSDPSPEEEDRSQIIADSRSEEEDDPSEDLSSHSEDADVLQNQNGRVPAAVGSMLEANNLHDNISSDSRQDPGEHESENVAPSQANEVICIESSDEEDPVAKDSSADLPEDIARENRTVELGREELSEAREKGEGDECQMRDSSLRRADAHVQTHSNLGPISDRVDQERQFGSDHRNLVQLSRSSQGNKGLPLPMDLNHKSSQTAIRSADNVGFHFPSLQGSNSAFSASLQFAAARIEISASGLVRGVIRDHENSPRPMPNSLIQRRHVTNNADKIFQQPILPNEPEVVEDRSTSRLASRGHSGKRTFREMDLFDNDYQRPRKIQRKQEMVEFVPLPSPENTIQAFGQQRKTNESRNAPYHEQRPSLILERLQKLQREEQKDALSTFRLPPLTATLGQVYNPHPSQLEPVMFRQGSVTVLPKKSTMRRKPLIRSEVDKKSFLEESRKRLEAHRRSAPSLQSSRSPFMTDQAKPSEHRSTYSSPMDATSQKQSEPQVRGHSKRVTFQAEIPSSKRRKGVRSD